MWAAPWAPRSGFAARRPLPHFAVRARGTEAAPTLRRPGRPSQCGRTLCGPNTFLIVWQSHRPRTGWVRGPLRSQHPGLVPRKVSVGHGYQPCRAEHTAKSPPSRQSLPACNVGHARLACPTPTSNSGASRQGGTAWESLLFIVEQETEYSLTAENTASKIWVHGFI